ncbi:MAG: DUF1465 family protein [Pseudomonadota bacterium]
MTVYFDKGTTAAGPETFVRSELFAKTFREGMALVEETAEYLDGAGRAASKTLARGPALAYAGASMRLTTQLMQIASWLLVMRAVREGDMALDEARDEKYRINQSPDATRLAEDADIPDPLQRLSDQTHQLYARIVRLDGELFARPAGDASELDAAAQLRSLHRAFGQ